jgi:hypothetical protein
LAYEWSNLLLSCQLCNQRFKQNLFPLLNPADRAKSHKDDITKEKPVLVNPEIDDPKSHITFDRDMASPVKGDERGDATIKQLGLNRPDLLEQRAKLFVLLKRINDLSRSGVPTAIEKEAEAFLLRFAEDSAEYAGMVRAAIRVQFA